MIHPAIGQAYRILYVSPIYQREMQWSQMQIGPYYPDDVKHSLNRLTKHFPYAKSRVMWFNESISEWQEISLNPAANKYALFSED